MENDQKPAYLVGTNSRTSDYNLGMMDSLLWARQEIGHKDLPAQSVRAIRGVMEAMIRDCQDRRLDSFEASVVPIRIEHERIDSLVDGCEFVEVHVKK